MTKKTFYIAFIGNGFIASAFIGIAIYSSYFK